MNISCLYLLGLIYFISDLKNLTNLEVLGLADNNADGPIPIEGEHCLLHL